MLADNKELSIMISADLSLFLTDWLIYHSQS